MKKENEKAMTNKTQLDISLTGEKVQNSLEFLNRLSLKNEKTNLIEKKKHTMENTDTEDISIKCFKLTRAHLLSCWKAVKRVLENDIVTSNEERSLLLELISDIAKQDKDTKREFIMKIKPKQIVPLWHCLRIYIDNEFYKDHTELPIVSQIITEVAIEADKESHMNTKPSLKLV